MSLLICVAHYLVKVYAFQCEQLEVQHYSPLNWNRADVVMYFLLQQTCNNGLGLAYVMVPIYNASVCTCVL